MSLTTPNGPKISVEIVLNDGQVREALTHYCRAGGFDVQSLEISVSEDGKVSARGHAVRAESPTADIYRALGAGGGREPYDAPLRNG